MPKEQEDFLKQQMSSDLITAIVAIRQRRRLVEENWLRSRRTWMNLTFDNHYKSGETSAANYNIPAGRRAIERTVVRGVKLLTPNVKWFELSPMGDSEEGKIENVDKFMWYLLRKRIKSRSNISQLVRSMILYGICHLKTSVTVQNNQVWPTQRVVDPFAFYIFPETASNIDEADIIFEDFLFSFDRYTLMAKMIGAEPINKSDLTTPDWPYHLTERLAYQGITDFGNDINIAKEKVGESLNKTGSAFVSLTELWLPKEDGLYQVYIAWNLKDGAQIVSFFRSEYDTPLYRSVVHRPLPGELYTNSSTDDINELDTMQKDQINKFQDAVDWEQGFVIAQGQTRHDSWKMKARALWLTQDDPKTAFQFVNPPDTSSNQLRSWQILLGLINSLAGTGTIAEGQPGRNMPRSGEAVNNLVNLSMADIQDVAELIEQGVLTPGLSDIYKVATRFIPDDQLMKIPGGSVLYNGQQSSVIKRDHILGDYEFEWVGSLQFQDEAARAQRLMIFLNMMPTLAPILQQQGFQFNAAPLLKMIWRYGLGERGLAEVVVPIQQQQQQQQPSVEGLPTPQPTSNGTNGQSTGGIPPVSGLKYNLPKATSGFVKQ